MRLYSDVEGAWTPFPSVLTDGQVDRRKVQSVSTKEMGLHVSEITTRDLVDGVLITLGRNVKPDGVEKGRLRPPGSAPVVCLIVRATRRTWARHVMLTNGITFLQRRRRSTRRCTWFEQGRCR